MIIKSLEHLNLISIQIGKKITSLECIFLFGEIGTGKTSFSRNLINFLQKEKKIKPTEVPSPTFNLLYEYEIKDFKVMHYDLYRLKNKREIEQLGIFGERDKTIKIIEWPELIQNDVMDRLELKFGYLKNDNERNLDLIGYGKWKDFIIDEL
tara:strand:+ start:5907 stop:6362 length:456 start_codon:yes stop_codon:yes gene_type:complete